MQFPGTAKPPVGIVFDAAMDAIGDALALAMLHGFEGKDQARIAAICVSSGDLRAAQFCDAVGRFYASATTGPAAMFMHFMPIGLATNAGAKSAESAMLANPVDATAIKSINDTADAATLIRNVLMAQYDQNAAIVLSGPPTDLAHLLGIYGVKEWITRKVRLLCMAETGMPADAAAARKVFAEWPTPIVTVGREIGEALPFPGDSIEKDFAYATPHPIAAAYRAYKPMPYDAPSCAMAAMLYAVRPDDGYFQLSGSGNPRSLVLDPAQKDRIIKTYIEMASAKPVPRKPRRPPNDKDKDKDKDKDEDKDKKDEQKKKDPAP
jgi:ABC-type transporter Mla MlaB component